MSADVMPRRSVPDLGADCRRAMTSQQAAPAKSVAQDRIGPEKNGQLGTLQELCDVLSVKKFGRIKWREKYEQTKKKAQPPLLNHIGATSHGMALLMGKHSAPGCQILVPRTSCLYIGFMQKVYVCVYKRTSTRAR